MLQEREPITPGVGKRRLLRYETPLTPVYELVPPSLPGAASGSSSALTSTGVPQNDAAGTYSLHLKVR
jgi:hypothetical protein